MEGGVARYGVQHMRVTIRHKLITNLTETEYYIYSRCNMYGYGQMRGAISASRKRQEYAYAILAEHGSHLLGCAYFNDNIFMLYVRKEHRRQGIGTRIHRRAKRIAAEKNWTIREAPWDDRSIGFFHSLEAS